MIRYWPVEEWAIHVPEARWRVIRDDALVCSTFDLDTARSILAWEHSRGRVAWLSLKDTTDGRASRPTGGGQTTAARPMP